jgi:cytochrome oxidase Cu insertion factor (SCO1/SenC/PrrC family)
MRNPTALLPYLLLAVALAGGLLWREAETIPAVGHSVSVGSVAVGGPFSLTDQDGRGKSLADFRGRYVLLYFGYTRCPDVCPTTLAVMAAALAKLGMQSGRVVPVFVTIDPARDTPAILKLYVKSFGPNFIGLTGSAAELAKVEREYRVVAVKHALPGGGYAMDHSSVLYLLGPDGKLAAFYDEAITSDALAKDLRQRL